MGNNAKLTLQRFTSMITYFSYIFVLYLTGTICLTLSAKLAGNYPAIKLLASFTKKKYTKSFS